MIRLAREEDLERLTEIYNQAIASRVATADLDVFTPEQRRPWFEAHSGPRTPLFVYEQEGEAAGYCHLTEYRPGRKALESIAEISYYLDARYQRMGIGSKLVAHTIEEAKRQGYRNLMAVLLSCNEGSRALLQKYGFVQWGLLPEIVYIDDQVYSHLYYGLKL